MSLPTFQRIAQTNDSNCGPAVLQMLLDFYQLNVAQDEVIQAAGAEKTIEEDGTTLEQLSLAVEKLAPGYQVFYKEDATIADISTLIHHYQLPVSVNWQGFFYDSLEEEKHGRHLFHGHYSIVADIQTEKETITIADPYYEFATQDRTFPIDWFKIRWWDITDAKDPTNPAPEKDYFYYTSRLLFVVVPNTMTFPAELGLQKVTPEYQRTKMVQAHLSHEHHPPFGREHRRWHLGERLTNRLKERLKRQNG